jgi:hypothetical protein
VAVVGGGGIALSNPGLATVDVPTLPNRVSPLGLSTTATIIKIASSLNTGINQQVPTTTPAEVIVPVQYKPNEKVSFTLNGTCFYLNTSVTYSVSETMPTFLTHTPISTSFIQNFTADFTKKVLASEVYSDSHTNSMKSTSPLGTFLTPFKILIYKCKDDYCIDCDYDASAIETGSEKCTNPPYYPT